MASKLLGMTKSILFIDPNVEDYEILVRGTNPNIKIVILDTYRDSIQQITETLVRNRGVKTVHIVSHGAPGCLYLGNSQLNINSINNNYAQELESWSVTNILLYGCNVAAGDAGTEFLEKLHQLTGANIAASAKRTGNVALGGDWELEVIRGKLEVSLAFSDRVQSEWEHILAAFEGQPYFYQVIAGQLRVFNPLTNNYEAVGVAHPAGYNATGFNTQDNFIYGIEGGSTNTSGNVVRINSDGTVDDLGVTINGSVNLTTGGTDSDGNLWVKTGNRQLTKITINSDDTVATEVVNFTGSALNQNSDDLAYNADTNSFYGVGRDRRLYIINLTDETITTSGAISGLDGRAYGAAWIDGDGDLYVSNNATGNLFRIDGYTTAVPTAVQVTNTESTFQNDGMSDSRQKSPFKVPFIDPDPTNTNAPFSHEDTFTQGDSGVGVVSNNVDIKDFDGSVTESGGVVQNTGGNILSATITLTNPQDSDELFVAEDLPAGISASGEGTNTITLTTGTSGASVEDFETALSAIQFRNTSDTPNTTPREIEIQLTDTDGDDGVDDTNNQGNIARTTINVIPVVVKVNDPPAFTALGNTEGNTDVTFTKGGDAVVLDGDAIITDPELDERDNYGGAILTLERDGGANSDDEFSSGDTGVLGTLTEDENLTVNGTTIGTVTTNSGGTLQLTFNSNATSDLVDLALQNIAYRNTNDTDTAPDEITINYTINDGNIANDGSVDETVVLSNTDTEQLIDDDATISNQTIDYTNQTLVIERDGGANSDDVFSDSDTSTLGELIEGEPLLVTRTEIGTVTKNSDGRLELIFNESATTALVEELLQGITYQNTSNTPPDEVSINYYIGQGIGGSLSGEGTVVVNIEEINTPPLATDNSTSTKKGEAVSFGITNDDTDTDGALDLSTVDLDPATAGRQTTRRLLEGTYTVDNNGNLTFTPEDDFVGTATSINYTVEDNDGGVSNEATISVTVNNNQEENTTLNPGDIAFVQYNADDTDNFKFVALVDIPASEEIKFTDNGWLGNNPGFRTSEGIVTWTAPAGGISAGTVVEINDTPSASVGTVSGGSLNFSGSGDQILAYQGTDSFIAALNNEGAATWQADASDTNTSALPQGLTNGTNAVAINEIDNAIYTGTTTGDKATLLAAINNSANWTGSNSTNQSFSETFTIGSGGNSTPPAVEYQLEVAQNIGGSSSDRGHGIATDSNGNVWATGEFRDSIDIDGDGNNDLTSNGGSDSYVAKFDSNANLLFAQNIGGFGDDRGHRIATDNNGNVWVTGFSQGYIDIDSDGNNDLTPSGSYAVKFDTQGNLLFAQNIGGTGYDIAIDSNDNVWNTGIFSDTIDIDGDGNNDLTSNGSLDSYVAKFDSNGNLLFAQNIGGSNDDSGRGIAADSNGNVWATGYFEGSIDIDGDGNDDLTSNGVRDSYLAKFDNNGNLVFSQNIGGSSNDSGWGIATDSNGNVWATGEFRDSIDTDGDGNNDLTSNGSLDSYVAKFDSNGNFLFAQNIGGSGSDSGQGIATDSNGNMWATGFFNGSIDIDGDSNNDLISNGNSDGYVAKFDSNGNFLFAQNIGGSSGADSGLGIAIDSNGNNVWTTGYYFEYNIDIDSDGNNDLTNNGSSDSYIVKFSPVSPQDTTSPTATNFTPADNTTDIAIGANLVIDFDENIQLGTGNIVIKKVSDHSIVDTIDVASSQVSISNDTVTIDPTADLAEGTEYYVEIAAGAIEDITGNDYAGISGNSSWTFTTGVQSDFTENTSISLTGVNNGAVATADFDNDGYTDILLTGADNSWNHISKIYTNDGSGGFSENTDVSLTGVYYSAVATADFDNDGNTDILLTGTDSSNNPVSKIYTNDGSGGFSENTDVSLTGVHYSAVATADFDNDGNTDILLTGIARDGSNKPISKIYTNDGSGGFSENTDVSLTDIGYGAVATSDLDNDGDIDILLTGEDSSDNFISKVYTNDGSGGFSENTDVSLTDVNNGAIATADFNNDGYTDILLTGQDSTGNSISKVYTNDGTGGFSENTDISLTGVNNGAVATADFNKDGYTDILLTGEHITAVNYNNDGSFSGWSGQSISKVYTNDGSGGFSENTDISLPFASFGAVATADFDKDDKTDILLTGSSLGTRISKIYNNNTPDITAPTATSFTPADNTTDIAIGEDLVIEFNENIQAGTGNIVIKQLSDNSTVETIDVASSQVSLSNDTVTIDPTADLAEGTEYYVEIDAGAIEDTAGNDYAGISGNSSWNFTTAANDSEPVRFDFNGDGVADILWRNSNNGINRIWLMNNNGTVNSTVNPGSYAAGYEVQAVQDFNQNGVPDILWRNGTDGNNRIWLMNNDGSVNSVANPGSYAAGYEVQAVQDFNQNGVPDILWRNSTNGNNRIWLMNNDGSINSVANPSSYAAGYEVQAVQDFNQNGVPDILWRNSTNGNNRIWLMNNDGSINSVANPGSYAAGYGVITNDLTLV